MILPLFTGTTLGHVFPNKTYIFLTVMMSIQPMAGSPARRTKQLGGLTVACTEGM